MPTQQIGSDFNVNAELLSMEHEEVGDYVIVHELLHFFAPNHGKLWKNLMRAHLGEYERASPHSLPRRLKQRVT